MNPEVILIFSKLIFGGSIVLVVYLAYREYMINKFNAEKAKIQLEEKENEDIIKDLSESDLVDRVNEELSGQPKNSSTPKK